MPLTRAEARLEALKLACRPGLELDSVLATAERYASFIMDETEPKLADAVIAKVKKDTKK